MLEVEKAAVTGFNCWTCCTLRRAGVRKGWALARRTARSMVVEYIRYVGVCLGVGEGRGVARTA